MNSKNLLLDNFLGGAHSWYKNAIIAFLILNPIVFCTAGNLITSWLILLEFIFILATALICYPFPPGLLLALEAIIMGLVSPDTWYAEVNHNFPVILLLIFMVAGIYFMQDLLLMIFNYFLVKIRNKIHLSLMFVSMGAILSAFLDALTVTAVIISIAAGFYKIYHRFASNKKLEDHSHDHTKDETIHEMNKSDLNQFRGFLRNLLMHSVIGTMLGGVMTMVGEPQNLLIAHEVGWEFLDFFIKMSPITIPVFIIGVITTIVLEKTKLFGYGYELPPKIYNLMKNYMEKNTTLDKKTKTKLIVQGVVAILLVGALAFHLLEVGLIGLSVIGLLTAFNGIVEEHQIGKAFQEALPFTALLVVFFAIVGMIHEQHMFKPILEWTLSIDGKNQLLAFFFVNGLLSMISDNVFVASIYISEVKNAFELGSITKEQFELISVMINSGTNIPSIATPNGQAALLFLLTSSISSLIRLSYMRMLYMALPYTIILTTTAILSILVLFGLVVDKYNLKRLFNIVSFFLKKVKLIFSFFLLFLMKIFFITI